MRRNGFFQPIELEFCRALAQGDNATVGEYLTAGKDPNLVIGGFFSPLMYTNSPEVMQTLLDYGAKINWQNEFGYSALSYAVKTSCTTKAVWLCEHGVDTTITDEATDSKTLFEVAYGKGNLQLVAYFLEHGVSADWLISSIEEQTILMNAAICGKVGMMRCILEHGADLYKKDTFGCDALDKAIQFGQLDAVKCLFERYPAEKKGEIVDRALNRAIVSDQLDAVKYLLECCPAGEKEAIADRALSRASFWKQTEIVNFLSSQGAKVIPQRQLNTAEQEELIAQIEQKIKKQMETVVARVDEEMACRFHGAGPSAQR